MDYVRPTTLNRPQLAGSHNKEYIIGPITGPMFKHEIICIISSWHLRHWCQFEMINTCQHGQMVWYRAYIELSNLSLYLDR